MDGYNHYFEQICPEQRRREDRRVFAALSLVSALALLSLTQAGCHAWRRMPDVPGKVQQIDQGPVLIPIEEVEKKGETRVEEVEPTTGLGFVVDCMDSLDEWAEEMIWGQKYAAHSDRTDDVREIPPSY